MEMSWKKLKTDSMLLFIKSEKQQANKKEAH